MATKAQFDKAAQRLLGEDKYHKLFGSGYARPDFCREFAQDEFIGALLDSPAKQEDLELIRQVADRLWKGDGVTGLDD